MELIFRLGVQVGAAILLKGPEGHGANKRLFDFVHPAAGATQGLQLLGIMGEACRIQGHLGHALSRILHSQGIA